MKITNFHTHKIKTNKQQISFRSHNIFLALLPIIYLLKTEKSMRVVFNRLVSFLCNTEINYNILNYLEQLCFEQFILRIKHLS